MRGLRSGYNIMLVIESARFAREQGVLCGSLPVESFTRLLDSIVSHDGEIQYRVCGGVDKLSRATIRLELDGAIEVLCQRCLTPTSFMIAIDSVLTLFLSEEAIDLAQRDDPDIEGIILTEKLDVAALIEDELILTLPYAPTHQKCGVDTAIKAVKPNPFSVLATLKAKPAK